MENSPYSALKRYLSSTSALALNYSCRLILSNNLDTKQLVQSEKGFIRDYRGLADLMGFQYQKIKEFEGFEDRTMKILEKWETRPDSTLDKLITYLELMDHHVIIDSFIPSLKRSVDSYLAHQKSLKSEADFQDYIIYDAYVSFADEDSEMAEELVRTLETKFGLTLFFRGRDILDNKIWWSELDTNIELIKKRCKRLLILLTANFMKSSALEFLELFEKSLDNDQKHRSLLPVIVEACEIPKILMNLTKIDLTKDYILECMWQRLINSLLPESKANTSTYLGGSQLMNKDATQNSAFSAATENVTAKKSTKRKHSLASKPNPLLLEPSDLFKNTDSSWSAKDTEPILSRADPSTSLLHQFISLLKRKVHSPSVSSTSFSTGATSSFHSELSDIKSLENSNDYFSSI